MKVWEKIVFEKVGSEIKGFKNCELNCIAMQMKLELYTSEHHWKKSDV